MIFPQNFAKMKFHPHIFIEKLEKGNFTGNFEKNRYVKGLMLLWPLNYKVSFNLTPNF